MTCANLWHAWFFRIKIEQYEFAQNFNHDLISLCEMDLCSWFETDVLLLLINRTHLLEDRFRNMIK